MGESLPFLRNSYWILRHGKSIPNENGLIVSSMANGTLEEFGLAPEGIHQAKLAAELLNKTRVHNQQLMMVGSRAKAGD